MKNNITQSKFKNNIWKILTIFSILAISHLACYENIIVEGEQNIFLDDSCYVKITNVSDGDTYEATEQSETVRIQAIDFDCYELKKSPKLLDQAESSGIEPDSAVLLGKEAKRLAERLLLNRTVLIVRDSTTSNFDNFSGLNRRVILNSENIREIFKFYGLLAE